MTNEQLDLLLKLTRIRSETLIAAVRAVLIDGVSQKAAAGSFGVNEGQLSRRLASLRETEEIVLQLAAFYHKPKGKSMSRARGAVKEPRYHAYFQQYFSEDKSWLVELFCDVGMEWIEPLQKERDKEKAYNAANNITVSEPDVYSTDPLSNDFPCFHDWPLSVQTEFNSAVKRKNEQCRQMALTGKKVKCGNVTLYLDCQDGAHYFSTPCFDYGVIYKAALGDDNFDVEFDSVETAVYAFYNDWTDWNDLHGEAKRKREKLLMLEAFRMDNAHNTGQGASSSGCEHQDLGSLGYRHGDVVNCPFCGERAEVW